MNPLHVMKSRRQEVEKDLVHYNWLSELKLSEHGLYSHIWNGIIGMTTTGPRRYVIITDILVGNPQAGFASPNDPIYPSPFEES